MLTLILLLACSREIQKTEKPPTLEHDHTQKAPTIERIHMTQYAHHQKDFPEENCDKYERGQKVFLTTYLVTVKDENSSFDIKNVTLNLSPFIHIKSSIAENPNAYNHSSYFFEINSVTQIYEDDSYNYTFCVEDEIGYKTCSPALSSLHGKSTPKFSSNTICVPFTDQPR